MGRVQKDIYCFIFDENKKYYKADQMPNGDYVISNNSQPVPLKYNPVNLLTSGIEFATNQKYFSVTRSISYPLDFVKDGAAILRDFYHLKKGTEQKVYLTVIQWNGNLGIYELAYKSRLDLSVKEEDPKKGMFTVPSVDDSAWGLISQNDTVEYAIDCTQRNPKSVKVLLDGITLVNTYTYQTVQAPITDFNASAFHTMPFVLINQDGDSAGIITKNQVLQDFTLLPDLRSSGYWFFSSAYPISGVAISGSITFEWSTNNLPSGGLIIYFYTSLSQKIIVFNMPGSTGHLIPGKIYTFNFSFTIDLAVGENMFLIAELNDNAARNFTITPIVTNIFITTKTKPQPVIAYGIRVGDYLEQLSAKVTNNRFVVKSDFFAINNKSVILSGDAIRGIPNSKIYSSFKSFFDTFNAIYWMALRNINEDVFMEQVTEVYKQTSTIIDMGELIDVKLEPAKEYLANEVLVGCPDQDYRHPSGRLEFNSTNTFSIPLINTNKKLELVTKYRLGCYDITFLILDYQGGSTKDNSGDKSVYVVDISDDQGSATDLIETFENINIDNAPLEPFIRSPFTNDNINYDHPIIRGVAPAGSTVNIYADAVLDGSVVSDINGDWSYVIATALTPYIIGVTTGVHVIDASFGTLLDPLSTITILIDTSITQVAQIEYPNNGDSLYDNKPLIRGQAQFGMTVFVMLDGVLIGSVIADESCKWELQSGLIPDGNHVLDANGDIVNFNVDTNVAYPLITYIDGYLGGFILINNLPLIKGVAMPGTVVTLWLNYISYAPLGTATADAAGNWTFQVVPVNYPDPLSGISTILAPIPNGLNIISTSLVNHTVAINKTGYLLNRPAYSPITGVPDNTVFNVAFTPHRMLMNHDGLLASILVKQPGDSITFQKPGKNGNLSTTLSGVTILENSNVPLSSLGSPFLLLENAIIKTKTQKTFQKTLEDFNSGGIIQGIFRGTTLYMLPIGNMKINNITSQEQDWKLLMSPLTTFQSLLNLYKNGLTIKLMKNSIYHSDYNSLHFVTYNFTLNNKFNFKDIYDDWFSERNSAWVLNPAYIQKFQQSEIIVDQIISNGVSDIHLDIYRCIDAVKIGTIDYLPVTPVPIPLPDVVLEAVIDFSLYSEQIFFVMRVGSSDVAISERVDVKQKWLGTILVESLNSINYVGAFFSTGFTTVIRMEGLVKKWQPDVDSFEAKEESGNTELLWAQSGRKRIIRFGTAYGLPDYLYLKVANALTMDNLLIENVSYALGKDEKINPSEDVDGHPLYYYNVVLTPTINDKGAVFAGAPDAVFDSVVLVVDATAFGLPSGSLINIDVN